MVSLATITGTLGGLLIGNVLYKQWKYPSFDPSLVEFKLKQIDPFTVQLQCNTNIPLDNIRATHLCINRDAGLSCKGPFNQKDLEFNYQRHNSQISSLCIDEFQQLLKSNDKLQIEYLEHDTVMSFFSINPTIRIPLISCIN